MGEVISFDETAMRVAEYRQFIKQRPEYAGMIGTLLQVAADCSNNQLELPNISLEQAHEHLYGRRGCAVCRERFEQLRDQELTTYSRPRIFG